MLGQPGFSEFSSLVWFCWIFVLSATRRLVSCMAWLILHAAGASVPNSFPCLFHVACGHCSLKAAKSKKSSPVDLSPISFHFQVTPVAEVFRLTCPVSSTTRMSSVSRG